MKTPKKKIKLEDYKFITNPQISIVVGDIELGVTTVNGFPSVVFNTFTDEDEEHFFYMSVERFITSAKKIIKKYG